MAVFLNRNKRPLAAPIEVAEPFSERPPPSQYAKPWQVAAALSAAVTITKLIGVAPNSQAEPTPKKRSNPNASCSSGEGVWGRGASLREAASSPESPLPSALTCIYQIKRLCRAGDFVYNKLVETLSIEGAPQERRGRDVDSYDAAAAQNKDRLHDGSQPV